MRISGRWLICETHFVFAKNEQAAWLRMTSVSNILAEGTHADPELDRDPLGSDHPQGLDPSHH